MNAAFIVFDNVHHLGESATHPITRLSSALPVLLFVAGAVMRLIASCQATLKSRTRARSTAVSRII